MVQDFLRDHLCMASELRVDVGKESFKTPAQVAPAQSKKCRDHLYEDSNQQTDACEYHHERNDGIKMFECHSAGCYLASCVITARGA